LVLAQECFGMATQTKGAVNDNGGITGDTGSKYFQATLKHYWAVKI
jgi:hypothetical protein